MSRKLDLSQFRGDSSDEEDLPLPKKRLELDALKSKTFSYGVTKKTKKDIEREEAERKRIEDERLAQIALEEFAQAFEGETDRPGPMGRRGKGFVRAGYTAPHADSTSFSPRQTNAQSGPSRVSPPPSTRPRGKRAMDTFLEEIKSNQESREARLGKLAQREGRSVTSLAAFDGPGGIRQTEAESTNLFIGNLPNTVSEDSLGKLFAKAGPVGTVKIMWPRDYDHHRSRAGLTGFVCFMQRQDAERAVQDYDGFDWNGNVLRVTWSKPVPIPKRAAYDAPSRGFQQTPDRPGSERGRPDTAHRDSPTTSFDMAENLERKQYWLGCVETEQQEFLEAVAKRVHEHGKGLLNTLRQNERSNPKFNFLFDNECADHHVFNYFMDNKYTFPPARITAFEDEGYASFCSTDSAEEKDQKEYGKAYLGKLARRRFEAMLRGMTGKRVEIARAMEFALKHAEAADEIVETICQSLCIDETPVPRKIARLHLVSDILHNSASPLPNVWRYRQAFEKRLNRVFAHLAKVHEKLLEHAGTISANVFRQQVEAVMTIWERWFVFTSDVLERLDKLLHAEITLEELERPAPAPVVDEAPQSQTKSAGFKSSFKRIDAAASPAVGTQNQGATSDRSCKPENGTSNGGLVSESAEDVDGETIADEDVDGEAMEEDVDGEAMEEDVDGEAMEEGWGGEALDEGLDGEAMEEDPDGEAI